GHMLDLLKTRGKNGALAFLESLKPWSLPLTSAASAIPPALSPPPLAAGLIETSKLTECLAKAVNSLQEELTQEKHQKASLLDHCRRRTRLRRGEAEHGRMRRELSAHFHEVLKLKDEMYNLSLRYTNALQEKDLAITRSQGLQEELYVMKQELQRARAESHCGRERALRMPSDLQPPADELLRLRGPPPDPAARLCVLAARQCWEEREHTLIACHRMKVDCEIYKEKIGAFQEQVAELQKERDQAYSARDVAQLEIAQNLLEKDSLRRKVFELTDQLCELRKQAGQQQAELGGRVEAADGLAGLDLRAQWPKRKQQLVRMHAICPGDDSQASLSGSGVGAPPGPARPPSPRAALVGNGHSRPAPPPAAELRSRRDLASRAPLWSAGLACTGPNEVDFTLLAGEKVESPDLEYELVEKDGHSRLRGRRDVSDPRQSDHGGKGLALCSRRPARRIPSRITTVAFHGNALLEQIGVIGGNQTGIFIHQVTPGSVADEMCLTPGNQIMVV
uniref:PDZ domain-containing protein n=1 Tax=Pelodiscus sinensis TaxID=13735 RepID=K7F543_PELSI